jgi:tRNA (guanine37-N1)-methyltransferase
MRVDVLTIFPEMFRSPMEQSILGRAQAAGLLKFRAVDLRDFTTDRHRTVDDTPFGGGAGMVMKPEPIFRGVEALIGGYLPDAGDAGANPAPGEIDAPGPDRVILMSPLGRALDQDLARELSYEEHLLILCGRYEGIDERVHEHLVTDEISVGDYVLTGGELAAMVLIDAVARLIPGVLGHADSAQEESFSEHLLEYPQYTRPAEFRGWRVPEVLLSGNHEAVRFWRRRQALLRTLARRPDLFRDHHLTEEDAELLGIPRRKRRRNA